MMAIEKIRDVHDIIIDIIYYRSIICNSKPEEIGVSRDPYLDTNNNPDEMILSWVFRQDVDNLDRLADNLCCELR